MASSIPSSPMASDLPSSPSSHASDASSPASLPSSPVMVSSVDEVRHIVKSAEPEVQLKFRLALDTPLAEAHKLWDLVCTEDGGHGELANPDLLSNKEEALHFVGARLERLRRWRRHVDRKHSKLVGEVSKLEKVIDSGGPGVPAGYQPHRYDGPAATTDVEQDLEKEAMGDHIAAIRALLLQRSPGSPTTDGGEGSVKECLECEAKEQSDITCFNLAYLKVKASGLELLSNHLESGVGNLEKRFIHEPSHLGAGDAEFIRFTEIDMYPGEAPRKP